MSLQGEIDKNYERFYESWTAQAPRNWATLAKEKFFRESYRRLCCLGALKRDVVVRMASSDSAAFMLEAHNDALTSHVMANLGAWRVSLQALRSCIENTLCCLFYKDHPIELRLWALGKYRTTFSDMHEYFVGHPDLTDIGPTNCGLDQIAQEYKTLSFAVHGSAANFRMTDNIAEVLLWDSSTIRASKWATREHKVLEGLSLLICYLHRSELQGSRLPHVRELLGFVLTASKRNALKKLAKVGV